MKNKRFYLNILIQIIFITNVFGEIIISVDTGIVADMQNEPMYSPNIGISGNADTYDFINENWSFFLFGNGEISYLPVEEDWFYGFEFQGDISFRKNKKLLRFSLYSDYEGSDASSLDYWGLTPEIYYSVNTGPCTIFTNHSATIDFAKQNNMAYDGGIGISLLLTPNLILDPHIAGGVQTVDKENEFYLDTILEYSWYPGIPFILDGKLGFTQFFSSSPFYKLYLENELTISFGSLTQIVLTLPSILQFNRDLSEASLFLTPQAAVDLSLNKNGLLILAAESQLEKNLNSKDFNSLFIFSIKLLFTI